MRSSSRGVGGGVSTGLKPKVSKSSMRSSSRGVGGFLLVSNPKFLSPPWEVPILWGEGGGYYSEPSCIPGCYTSFWAKKSQSLACSCIADSLSHTMFVETDLHLAGQGATVFYFQFDYRPKRSFGKVMLLHMSVILSMGGRLIPPRQTPPSRHTHPRQTHTPQADAHTPGRHPSPRQTPLQQTTPW